MSVLSFTWKGISSDSYGIDVLKLPAISIPQLRDDAVTVPGRSGRIHLQSNAHPVYEEITATCSCYINYEDNRGGNMTTIRSWLSGSGVWTQSDMPGVYYNAHIIDQTDMQPWVQGFSDRTFIFTILLEPFKYDSTPVTRTLTSAGTIAYSGTVYAEPRITVTATGNYTLTINGDDIEVTAASGASDSNIIIDSELMECLEDDGETFANTRVVMNDFPLLSPGNNTISWTGSVTSVAVLERVRYL